MCANVSPCPLQGKGRKRGFEIIRKPELEGSSFFFNNVLVRYVGTCPETGISFYCNDGKGCVLGVRVYDNGRKVQENTTNNHNYVYTHGQSPYLRLRNAFGNAMGIYASHAVWMAAGRTIPAGMTIDHIDGCTTNNYIGNLRCVSDAINHRDGGFLKKLRNKGIKTTNIQRPYLLRYFDRMARLKPAIPRSHYARLTRDQLHHILYDPEFSIPV